jgi:hypothetical protein
MSKETPNFCTLFNSSFLSRGIAMIRSLAAQVDRFNIFVFAFDDQTSRVLGKLQLPNTTIISLDQFEDDQLLAIKNTRSRREYYWTCTPSTILYCLDRLGLQNCTYVDADLCFYSGLDAIWEEVGTASVALTPHRYTPAYDQSSTSGIYCVQFVYFRGDEDGMHAARWWRSRCLEWCYARMEDGKFGDQKYLDDWTERFRGVHVVRHFGAGVAPWNIQRYRLQNTEENMWVEEGDHRYPVVFYHYHDLRIYADGTCDWSTYPIGREVERTLYYPYVQRLKQAAVEVRNAGEDFDTHGRLPVPPRRRGIVVFARTYATRVIKAAVRLVTELLAVGTLKTLKPRSMVWFDSRE